MRRFRCPLAALLALSSVLTAPVVAAKQQVPVVPEQAAPAREIRPALWKVADADTTIYLFGTVHALPPGIAWYRDNVMRALEGSKELVTEIPESEPASVQALVTTRAMLPAGENLRAMMTATQRESYEAALANQGLPVAAFDEAEPWFAAMTIATLPLLKTGYTLASGVEPVLTARAKALGLRHRALETVEFQFGLFDNLPLELQESYLGEVIEKLPEIHGELSKIVEAWKIGDAEGLAELMNDVEDDPELIEELLLKRNRAWADWINTRLDAPGQVFVAVGAGHLAGKGSVQQELGKRGLTVTRVQ